METGRMRAIGSNIQKGFAAYAFAPASMNQHPRAGRDAPVLALPGFDMFNLQEKVLGSLDFGGDIDHTGGPDKSGDGNGVGGVIAQVFAGNPVHRRIEMRARVLADQNTCSPKYHLFPRLRPGHQRESRDQYPYIHTLLIALFWEGGNWLDAG